MSDCLAHKKSPPVVKPVYTSKGVKYVDKTTYEFLNSRDSHFYEYFMEVECGNGTTNLDFFSLRGTKL